MTDVDVRLEQGVDDLGAGVEDEAPEWGSLYEWPTLGADARYGLVGEIIDAVLPHTEADPAALVFTLRAMCGNAVGPDLRARVGDDDHPARLFVAIVGDSSSGAKGTSYSTVRPFIRAAHAQWYETRILNGFSSGEALISEFQDDAEGQPADKRLFVLEPGFARILTVGGRDGSTLSMVTRVAWDGGGRLSVRRAKDRIVADGTHISIVGHITPEELRARLAESDLTNGFANRFLYVCSERSKKLPSGG